VTLAGQPEINMAPKPEVIISSELAYDSPLTDKIEMPTTDQGILTMASSKKLQYAGDWCYDRYRKW